MSHRRNKPRKWVRVAKKKGPLELRREHEGEGEGEGERDTLLERQKREETCKQLQKKRERACK